MADRGPDRRHIRNVGETEPPHARPVAPPTSGQSQPSDAGKTSGGGSLGHDQPADVAEQERIRNQATTRDTATLRDRDTPGPVPELEP